MNLSTAVSRLEEAAHEIQGLRERVAELEAMCGGAWEEDGMEVAQRMRRAMDARGVGRSELRREIGCSHAAMDAWFTGARVPTVGKLADICRALDVSADYLMGLKDEME